MVTTVKINRKALEQNLCFYLGKYMATGLFTNYPQNFNAMMPKLVEDICKNEDKLLVVKHVKEVT